MSIAGIGKLNIDLIYEGLPRLPEEGEEIYSKSFSMHLGGGTPGTLINLSRLNVPTKLLTYLGDDFFSKFCKEELDKNKTAIINLYSGKGMAVNVSSALLTKNDRTFVSYGEEDEETQQNANIFLNESKGSKFVIMQLGAYLDVYKELKKLGVKLVLDPGYTDDMSIEAYGEYLKLANYYLPNRKEALRITGADTIEEAAKILSKYFDEVVIKLDKDGTLLYKDGGFTMIKSLDIFKHKDSTGAGDAFLAGFLYGLYHNFPIEKCIKCGNVTGGKCVTECGCLTAYVTENELLNLIL